jgi:hypothetical protein
MSHSRGRAAKNQKTRGHRGRGGRSARPNRRLDYEFEEGRPASAIDVVDLQDKGGSDEGASGMPNSHRLKASIYKQAILLIKMTAVMK